MNQILFIERYITIEHQLQESKIYEQKAREYEGRISLLTQEIERLNQVLRSRLDQNEQWKSKYSTLELQLSEVRVYEQKSRDYEGRISLLSQEIERLNSVLRTRIGENDDQRRVIDNLKQGQSKYSEYENRIALLSQEIERLNRVLRDRINENDDLKMKSISAYDSEAKCRVLNSEIDRLQNLNSELQKQLDVYRSKFVVEYRSSNYGSFTKN